MRTIADGLAGILVEVPLSAVLRERLQLAKDRLETLEEKVISLEEENAALKQQVGELDRTVANRAAQEEFVEYCGAFFKRKVSGGYHKAIYCPACRLPMSSFGDLPYVCSCSHSVDFTGHDFDRIMKELSEENL